MIAYLEKYDTTAEVPDNASDKDIQDINENFTHYTNPPTATQPTQSTPTATGQTQAPMGPAAPASSPWQPNFYKSVMSDLLKPAQLLNPEAPESQAFAGKAAEELTFGATKPLIEPVIGEAVKEHPAFADAGTLTGGIGSLMEAGAALRVLGVAGTAASAGKTVIEAGLASGERFIPKAIMTGATFGTRTFIAETVKAFQEGGVNLEQFGKDVLKDTAFGAIFGTIGGLSNVAASVSSAGALGFISSKMSGADNREATLNGAIWGAFEAVGSMGKKADLRMEALNHLKDSMSEYAQARGDLPPEQADRAAGSFLDNAMKKAGYENAEAIAKSGPENLLEGIEKVNQLVRNAKIPAEPPSAGPLLPKLPAPFTPEPAVEAPEPTKPSTPLEKALETVRGILGLEKPKEGVPELPEGPKSYDEKIADLKAQGHDLMAIPPEKFPEDLRDIRHFEEAKGQKINMEKNLGEIAERFQTLGIAPKEGAAIFQAYNLDKKGQFGQTLQPSDLLRQPIEEQYQTAFKSIAEQRGLSPEKPNAEIQDQAEKSVDLINSYFNPQSQEVKAFATQHGEVSDHDVAQMAYDRGIIEQPNPDLLKTEIQKANQEPKISAMFSGSSASAQTVPLAQTPHAIATHLEASANELTNIINPTKAAPLATQITRENLGKMARSYDMAEAALSEAHDLFEKQPKEKNIEFIDKLEHGQVQSGERMEKIAATLRNLLDTKRQEIQDLGTGKLQSFIENYFPHIWDQGEKQVSQATMKAAKRPLEGSKSFLKERKIEFTKEGIEAGLTPISYNPVDLTLLKIREMDKYLMAHRTLNEFKDEGLSRYVKVGQNAPEGWVKIDDRISTVFKSPMVVVKEAYDEKMMEDLQSVAKGLGVNLERGSRPQMEGKKYSEAWGLSKTEEKGKPGKVWTRFAGPESALAHELGHQIDEIYGLQEKFLGDEKINKELTDLANQRADEKSNEKFKSYIQQPDEKMAVMLESYIHAPDLFKEVAPAAYEKFNEFLNQYPKLKLLTQIKPSLQMATAEGEVYAGGSVIAGSYYAQPDAARIINNYLSPGLQKSALYRAYRFAGNLLNQFQLSMSMFHAGFTTIDSAVSKFALGLNQLAEGHPLKALANILSTPFAPVTTVIKGDQLLKAWRGQGQSPIDNVLAEAMASGGGRARMDQFYATKASEQASHYFKTGKYIKGIFSLPFSLLDISSRPTLEYLVPRMKLGAFSDIMRMEMENNPNLTHEQIREMSQKAWDSIDNRLGQMVYDNLFWNRTFKDLLMASVRSVGWNLGTLRELAGGAKDYAEAIGDTVRGKKTDFTYRMAYLTALPIIVGALGAMMQYIRTGKGPQEAKDYFFPKTGGLDANGDSHRVALPSYMKDIYHYSQAPFKTIIDKTNPLISMIGQMLENKDYYGTKIRNEDDPLMKQVMSESEYIGKQMIPFSIRNMQKNLQTQNRSLFDTVGPWVGITSAPYDIDQTPAEKLAHEMAMTHQEIGGRTEEQAERSRLVHDLTRQYKRDEPKAMENIFNAYQQGAISHRQMQEIIANSCLTPLQRMFKGMSLEEARKVYAKSSEEEKGQLESMMEKKELTHEREFVVQ